MAARHAPTDPDLGTQGRRDDDKAQAFPTKPQRRLVSAVRQDNAGLPGAGLPSSTREIPLLNGAGSLLHLWNDGGLFCTAAK